MSAARFLPDRPDLAQLRRQAKELRDAVQRGEADAIRRTAARLESPRPGPVTLAVAQLVIAREHGFASWSRLKAAVEAAAGVDGRSLSEFLAASADGRTGRAARLLAALPRIGAASISAAAVLGDVAAVSEHLARDPGGALATDADRGWPPLLYACYSCWPRIEPDRAPGVVAVARLLIDAGADPGTNNGGRPGMDYRSALHGAVSGGDLDLVRLLLERGADPDDRISVRVATQRRDHDSLRLLLASGANPDRTWSLETAAGVGDADGIRMLLEALARISPGDRVAEMAQQALHAAAEHGSGPAVAALLSFGASPDGPAGGEPPARLAVRAGHPEVAQVLIGQGASYQPTDADRLIGACLRADRAAVREILVADPDLLGLLAETDRSEICAAATRPDTAAVEIMLDLGFSASARNDMGETPLHTAAHQGRAGTVALLLEHGAEIDALDHNFEATALAYATVGSGERPTPDGDWVTTVRMLLDAGASTGGAWLSPPKAPSEEVAAVLASYRVRPESGSEPGLGAAGATGAVDEPEPGADATPPAPAELAHRLSAALSSADLTAFADLLDPHVRWGAGAEGCVNRDQVLTWYRDLARRGLRARVVTEDVVGDLVVLGLEVFRPATGAVPVPPQVRYQVYEFTDGLVTEITGYDDREAAVRHADGALDR